MSSQLILIALQSWHCQDAPGCSNPKVIVSVRRIHFSQAVYPLSSIFRGNVGALSLYFPRVTLIVSLIVLPCRTDRLCRMSRRTWCDAYGMDLFATVWARVNLDWRPLKVRVYCWQNRSPRIGYLNDFILLVSCRSPLHAPPLCWLVLNLYGWISHIYDYLESSISGHCLSLCHLLRPLLIVPSQL